MKGRMEGREGKEKRGCIEGYWEKFLSLLHHVFSIPTLPRLPLQQRLENSMITVLL